MHSLIQYAKGYYQFTKATLPELWARSRHPYCESDALLRTRASLGKRITAAPEQLNFIMAVPIVNWETTLIEHAKAYGTWHHIDFKARGFFGAKTQWREYRAANFARLDAGFEAAYKEDAINVLFLYLSEFHIDPSELARFRRHNVILVLFNWDDRLHYTSEHKGQSVGIKEMAKAVDLCLTMAVGPMSRYVADGASVFYWRGTNDCLTTELSLPKLEFNRVLFFGSRYGFRETLVEYLQKKGLPIDVYGAGWGTEFLSYENLAYRIPRYALNLGVSTIGYSRHLSCVKGRDIEVPSAGGLYLTNLSTEIEQVYMPGKEVLTYTSKNECYRKAYEVLANPTTFMQMRRDGVRKAHAFSWKARFNYLKELISKIVNQNAD